MIHSISLVFHYVTTTEKHYIGKKLNHCLSLSCGLLGASNIFLVSWMDDASFYSLRCDGLCSLPVTLVLLSGQTDNFLKCPRCRVNISMHSSLCQSARHSCLSPSKSLKETQQDVHKRVSFILSLSCLEERDPRETRAIASTFGDGARFSFPAFLLDWEPVFVIIRRSGPRGT